MDKFENRTNNKGKGIVLGDLIQQEFKVVGKPSENGKELPIAPSDIPTNQSDLSLFRQEQPKIHSSWLNEKSPKKDEESSRLAKDYYNKINNQNGFKSTEDIINNSGTKYIKRDQLIKIFDIPTREELEYNIKESIQDYWLKNQSNIKKFKTFEDFSLAVLNRLKEDIYDGSHRGIYDEIAEKLRQLHKGTNQGLQSIKPLLDFVATDKFPLLLDEDTTNKSLIDLFVQQYTSLSNPHLLGECWRDFSNILRKNIPSDLHGYYFTNVSIEIVPSTDLYKPTSWKITYASSYMYQKDEYEKIFNRELKPLFIKHICRTFGVDKSGFELCVQLQFDFKPMQKDFKNREYPKSYYKHPLNKPTKLIIHQGNAEAQRVLEKWLWGHLGDIESLNIPKHVGLCGKDYSGKNTMIQHYLNKYIKLFPGTKIKIMNIKNSARAIQAMQNIDDQNEKYSKLEEFKKNLEQYNVLYIDDFDELVQGDKFWLRGCIARVLYKNPDIKLVIRSKLPYSELCPLLENNKHGRSSDDKKKNKELWETGLLTDILESFRGMIPRVSPPSPPASYKILQGMVKQESMKLSDILIQSIASKTSSVSGYASLLEQIRFSREYEKWYETEDISKGGRHDKLMSKIILLLKDQVAGFQVEFSLDDTYKWFCVFWSNEPSLYDLSGDEAILLKQRMFICFAHRFTERMMFNSRPQNRTLDQICDKVFLKGKAPNRLTLTKRGAIVSPYVSQRDKYFQDKLNHHVLYSSFDLLKENEDIGESGMGLE